MNKELKANIINSNESFFIFPNTPEQNILLKQKESKILIILIQVKLSKEDKKEEKLKKVYHYDNALEYN